MILVDNSYIGHRISSARKTAKVRRNDAARMLRITPKKLNDGSAQCTVS